MPNIYHTLEIIQNYIQNAMPFVQQNLFYDLKVLNLINIYLVYAKDGSLIK